VLGMRILTLLILALVVTAYLNGVITDIRVWGPAILTVLAVVLLTLLQWTKLQHRWLGKLLLWLFFAVVIASLTAAGTIPELQSAVLAADLAVVALSAVMTGLVAHTIISALVAASYFAVVLTSGEHPADIIVPLVAVAGVSLAVGMLTRGFRRESRLAAERLATLKAREVDLARLYDVSTATSAAETVQEALPVLVGRIGQYLHAQVGALLLRDPNRPCLNVMSPIWTVGNALEVDGYQIPLRNAGDLERVYMSGSPAIFHDIDKDPDVHGLLGELGVHNAIAAPMKVEDRTLGVMVLADKVDGTFTEDDVQALVSLSTPTALAIAQLERIEEAAQTSRKMEELAAMKTDFVSVVSHELRTPLTSIIGSLATLTRPEFQPTDEMARDLLHSARSQAARLGRLIEDLLIVSRIEGRALPTQAERIDLPTLLAAAVADIPDTEQVSVECGPISLRSDPDHLQRIVINLVENALRYAGDTAVEVTASEDDEAVTISVVDHGPGIPAELRDRIFERFIQLGPISTRKQGGTGLGLAIVRGLVQAIGGTVHVEDTPGGGATFQVRIPKAPPDAPSARRKHTTDAKPLFGSGCDGMESSVDMDEFPGRHRRPV